MYLKKYVPVVLGLLLVVASCQPDDGNFQVAPERDRTEQQVVDNDSLLGYFETHYYNASTFDGSTDFTIDDIVITELPKDDDGNYLPLPDPDNNRLLIDELNDVNGILKAYNTVLLDIDYVYYVMKINQGGGEGSPSFADDIRVRYSGNLQDASVFDSAVTPVDFDLVNLVPGWSRVLPDFNEAFDFSTVGGDVTYTDYGLGVMFLPSGLGYFSSSQLGVPVYSNLIFKFELLQTEENDHDGDGIPSYKEDFDGEGITGSDMNVFNDDTDNDATPNFLDVDDDGDGVLTINEDADGDGDPTNDIGVNGIPRYLDPEETESFEEED
ncbi:hypothetical protein [Winogradskyella sp. 3972H.M.0a.05]|uniref:FKBP-type peptidyl-prolyl cis-trans isomerase n=1 Tax=Winogradskyella sp. 3972H.M.0a.05 TaxID=2950277 RepID=UPI00339AFF9B